MSYYNSPGLHVQHMGASHGITVSIQRKQHFTPNGGSDWYSDMGAGVDALGTLPFLFLQFILNF